PDQTDYAAYRLRSTSTCSKSTRALNRCGWRLLRSTLKPPSSSPGTLEDLRFKSCAGLRLSLITKYEAPCGSTRSVCRSSNLFQERNRETEHSGPKREYRFIESASAPACGIDEVFAVVEIELMSFCVRLACGSSSNPVSSSAICCLNSLVSLFLLQINGSGGRARGWSRRTCCSGAGLRVRPGDRPAWRRCGRNGRT